MVRRGKGVLAAGLCLVALAAGACGKDRPTAPKPEPALHDFESTPQNVLLGLIVTYQNRDSTGYARLYDEDYLGTSTDMWQVTIDTDSLYKDDERRHISALARSPDVVDVDMSLGVPSTWLRTRDESDPPGWATIAIPYPYIAIIGTIDAYVVGGVTGGITFDFKFAPTTPAPSSRTDTTWKVVRWTEWWPIR